MEVINELKELNLDDNEVKVYLTCLSFGSAKVNEIAKSTGLIRTTTYGVLKSLIQKGLVSTVLKDNVTYFQAATPKQLIEILEEKKKKISSVLPQLEKIQSFIPIKHKVEVFEGKEGFKTIFNDYVNKKNITVKIIGFLGKWLEFDKTYMSIYYRKKRENNVKTLALIDEKDRALSMNEKLVNSEFRYLKNLNFNSECLIYQEKVVFISFGKDELKGVIIHNKEMFELQNSIFDKLWKQAER